MSPLEVTINELAPLLYEECNRSQGAPLTMDQTRGSNCDFLTLNMLDCLQNRGYELRREYHRDSNSNWHYLLAHSPIDAEPSMNDMVTDLNPWQWSTDRQYSGLLHAPRDKLMQQLSDTGAPEFFIALRGLDTIVMTHKAAMQHR